ncbi:MAG: hypothetical protein NTW21_38175 [Verrucomicrobia bacterium]|nr:hypothetical protein [Verrucomicrobiota bacterium]
MHPTLLTRSALPRLIPAGRQPQALDTISVKTEGGSTTVESLEVFTMKSIWKK